MKLTSLMVLAAFILLIPTTRADEKLTPEFQKVMDDYSQGKYQTTVDELDTIKAKLDPKTTDKKTLGLIAYWKGLSYNRLQRFPEAIESFKEAKDNRYEPKDMNYEYGQALFAADKLRPARIQFNNSFKKGYKRGTCLYYMGFIARDLGEEENAKTLFGAVKKLPPEEMKEVGQAAEMQIGDMELEAAEKKPHALQSVEEEVIPVYENAYKLDPESPLAPRIKEKITGLQKKYQLVMFQLRNGRPTILPRYFLRAAQEFGYDTNVVYAATETTITKSQQASGFGKTEAMGRYTFYYKDFISLAPELRTTYTHYFHRIPTIYRNDNALIAPSIRTAFEHNLWGKPASTLLDYEYNEIKRDINAKEKLEFAGRTNAVMLGERFNYFSAGQSTLRFKVRKFKSFQETSNSKTLSLIYEQFVSMKTGSLLIYSSLDRTRVNTDIFDTDALTARADWLLPKYRDFNPSVGLAMTITDPINNRTNRGLEKLINPGLRLNRRFGRNWGANFRFEYYDNISKDKANFAYKKQLYAVELEYLF